MSEKLKAADLIERQARTFEAFIAAAAELRKIGSLEQAAAEATEQAAKARKLAAVAADDLAAAKAEVKAAKDQAKATADAAKARADALVEEGKAGAADMVASAKQTASSLIATAEEKVARLLSGVVAQRAALEADIDALTEKANVLMASIATKHAEADALDARLAKAQAQIAKLLS